MTNQKFHVLILSIACAVMLCSSTASAQDEQDCDPAIDDLCACFPEGGDTTECDPETEDGCICYDLCDPDEGDPDCYCVNTDNEECDTPNTDGCYCFYFECVPDPQDPDCICLDAETLPCDQDLDEGCECYSWGVTEEDPDIVTCFDTCATIGECQELEDACGPEVASVFTAGCYARCYDPAVRQQLSAAEGLPCGTVVPLVIDGSDELRESCGEENNGQTNNGQTNNGQTNNGQTNNGQTNNGASNNGASNNGASNNGASNNGASNNGASNNGAGDPGASSSDDGGCATVGSTGSAGALALFIAMAALTIRRLR